MRNEQTGNPANLTTQKTPKREAKLLSPSALEMLRTLEELQAVRRQLQYFSHEIKLWVSPQNKL